MPTPRRTWPVISFYYDGDSDTEMYQGRGANEGDSLIVIYLEDLDDLGSPTFSLTAFDLDGLESDFSDEVVL